MEELPYTSEELIEQLNKVYPLRNPKLHDSMELIQRRAGHRDVVDSLLVLLERTRKESTGG